MKSSIKLLIGALTAALVAACGGGGGGGTPAPSPQPAAPSFSSGVMTKGSVIVNGVRYTDDANTQVFDDRNRTFAQLDNGMVVKVRGVINDDGVNGRAERVEVENELRGTVTAVGSGNPPTITIGGVLVQTDDSTVYANVANAAGLTPNVSVVEVHGLRDGNTIRATRIELQAGPGLVDEFKGAVTGTTATTLTVSGVLVTPAAGAVFEPAGCTLAALSAGRIVEVHGSFTGTATFSATRVECEDLEDDRNGVKPPAGARNKIEGFVTGLTATTGNASGSFLVGSITVNFSASTQIRNGARVDLANGARVEVDGTLNGNTLTAREISFKQERIILQGTISATAGSTQLTVLGSSVARNDLTRVENGLNIATGTRVEVRARLVNGTLIADEIRAAGGGGSGTREIVQARATAKSATSVTLLGTAYNFSGSTQCKDSRGATEVPMTCSALLDAINVTTGTLVKVRGEPLSGGVTEAELES